MKTIDFIGKRYYWLVGSAVLMVLSVATLTMKGLVLGIDFTGGTLVEVRFENSVELNAVRNKLNASFKGVSVQYFGNNQEVMIRLEQQEKSSAVLSTHILEDLRDFGNADVRRVEFVGPKVGDELVNDGGLAMLYALIGILIYVAFRFEYRFALSSIFALIHDVVITLGFFSLFAIEVDLSVLAAILAIIGYSLNDTIVVFDRIRENFLATHNAAAPIVINNAINQTLSRTMMTSLTTILVLSALFLLGGDIIHNFATALLFGVIIGTYSSIYIASPAVLQLGVSKADLMPSEKERKEIDNRP